MKACTSCGVEKALTEFGPHKRSRDGLAYYCRACDVARVKRYQRSRPDPHRAVRRHGLTPEAYAALAADGCHGCGAADVPLVVDHDHGCCPGAYSCGQCVRGVLCRGCNLVLGQVADNADTLIALAAYLLLGPASGRVTDVNAERSSRSTSSR